MATTIINLPNEPKTGKPRTLNINVNNVNIGYSVDLKDTDGTLISAGKTETFQFNAMSAASIRGSVDPFKEAKEAFASAVAQVYEALYTVMHA